MVKLLLLLLNLPMPVLSIVLAGGFLLFLTVIVLVVCVPSASEKITHFLAQLKEVFYSGAINTPNRPKARLSEREGNGEGENE